MAHKQKKKLIRTFVVPSALILGGVGSAWAVPITVLNPSFESPFSGVISCGLNCSYNVGAVPNWTTTGNTGVFHPSALYLNLPLPNGVQTGYSNGGTLSQTLAATLQANTVYTLTVDVGRRLDQAFPGASITLLAGITVLGTTAALVPTPGNFLPVGVTYTSLVSDPLIGQNLRIVLTSNGVQINFDNVRLDAVPVFTPVPEPSSWALLLPGLASLLAYQRRKAAVKK